MDELLTTIALAVMVLSILGTLNIARSKKNGDDFVYRKVGSKWIKVRP